MSKVRTINIEPYDADIRRYEGGFVWTFIDHNKKINIKCDRWWISYLARDLRKVLKEEENELERLKELAGFIDE